MTITTLDPHKLDQQPHSLITKKPGFDNNNGHCVLNPSPTIIVKCHSDQTKQLEQQQDPETNVITVVVDLQDHYQYDKQKRQKPPFLNVPAFGIICSLIAVICFSFNSVIVKLLNSSFQISGVQVLVVRSLIQFLICLIILMVKGRSPFNDYKTNLYLFGRAITGTASMCCLFTAFNQVPIGDATTIYFSSPVFVAIFAYIFLHEPFRWLQSITCLITIVGVGFISKPAFIFGPQQIDRHYPNEMLGQILSIIAAITSSMTMIFIRKLKTTSAIVVVFWFSFSIMNCGTVVLLYFGTYRPFDWMEPMCTGPLLIIGMMSMVEQYFFTLALQYEDASTISVTRSCNIVLAFLWEVIIFHERVTWTSIVGAILVSCCTIVLAFAKSIASLKEQQQPKPTDISSIKL